MNMDIRQAHLSDLPYIYDICVKTADSGGDSRELLQDQNLVGQYFAAPYLIYEIECCFVCTHREIPVGYIVGCSDTESYNRWLSKEWLPSLRKKYAADLQTISSLEKFLIEMIHQDAVLEEAFKPYPAHLHIDILPDFQRKGAGKKLMKQFTQSLTSKRIPGLHFGVAAENTGALEFYKKVGYRIIQSDENTVMMGIEFKE